MITAPISEFEKYVSLHKHFATILTHMGNLSRFTPGERVELGSGMWASPALENGRTAANAPLEAHNKYIDVQVCIDGTEHMGWKHRGDCQKARSAFDTERDIVFFDDEPDFLFKVKPGHFAIFFPNDAHAPLIADETICKVVFKIPVE